MSTLIFILFLVSIVGIIKPKLFIKLFKKQKDLKKIRLSFVSLALILFSIGIFLIGSDVDNKTTQPQTDEEKRIALVNILKDREIDAESLVRLNVEDLLKAPSTAKFNLNEREEVESATGTAYIIVFGTVDSQNSFGAMLRSNIYAKLDYTNGKNGELVSLKIDDKEFVK